MCARSRWVIASFGFLSGLILASFGHLPLYRPAAVAASTSNDEGNRVDDDKRASEGLLKRVARLEDRLRFSPPVGTVMSYAGEWPVGDGQLSRELACGWMLCDGRKFKNMPTDLQEQLEDLKKVLAETAVKEGLPDYRGYFLRGMDRGARRDKDCWGYKDEVDRPGSVYRRREVNSPSIDTTSLPRAPFVVSSVGHHTHLSPTTSNPKTGGGLEVARETGPGHDYVNGGVPSAPVSPEGAHTHTLSGGDAETRPRNIAVHWIIKFKD